MKKIAINIGDLNGVSRSHDLRGNEYIWECRRE